MQMEAPEAIDLSKETAQTKKLYGIDRGNTFGAKCLLARRFIERGVRFVQVYSNDEWDAHGSIQNNHDARCAETDVPIAGLLADLKARGLLEETLVVWGGEFGRMPVSEGGQGRDHNPHGFLVWLAGAGVKGGVSYGETDEIGYKAAVNPVTVHDLHATMLHLLGLDHKRLTYAHNGRRFRLTDVAGRSPAHPFDVKRFRAGATTIPGRLMLLSQCRHRKSLCCFILRNAVASKRGTFSTRLASRGQVPWFEGPFLCSILGRDSPARQLEGTTEKPSSKANPPPEAAWYDTPEAACAACARGRPSRPCSDRAGRESHATPDAPHGSHRFALLAFFPTTFCISCRSDEGSVGSIVYWCVRVLNSARCAG